MLTAPILAALLLRAPALPPAPPAGPCPVVKTKPCVIELKGPRAPGASPECAQEPWSRFLKFSQPGKWSDSNKDGWWETVLAISLNPAEDCGCAHFKIFYDGQAAGFTTNIGDSPTNDGFGGDAGTTLDAAEVQILGNRLTVYSSEGPGARPTPIERLYDLDLPPLAGQSLDLEVCDQSLGFTLLPGRERSPQMKWKLQTLNKGLLFSLAPRTGSGEAGARAPQDHAIYAAFNRVIHVASGLPSQNSVGSGVQRVEITLTP